MDYLLLIAGSIICAALAIRAARLLTAALWLAGVSMFTALTLYAIGAHEVAVIELSVGAGLVTVLFVFAISIAGDDALRTRPIVPKSLASLVIILALLLTGILMLSDESQNTPTPDNKPFVIIFWQDRTLDVLVQIALIFAGVLNILGLLSEPRSPISPLPTLDNQESEVPPDDNPETTPQPVATEEPV